MASFAAEDANGLGGKTSAEDIEKALCHTLFDTPTAHG
jgi:hypothetical protein